MRGNETTIITGSTMMIITTIGTITDPDHRAALVVITGVSMSAPNSQIALDTIMQTQVSE